jgi:PAS domain S-box-containing protein
MSKYSTYLKQNLKIFTDLLNALNDIIIIISADGTIIFTNVAACCWLKSTADKMKGINLFTHLSDKENYYLSILLKTEKSQHFELENDEISFFYNYYPIINEVNKISQIAILVKDITKTRKLENKLINILEQRYENPEFDIYNDLEQHLTGMSYILQILSKRIENYSLTEKSLVSQIENCNKDAIDKLKKFLKCL